MSPVIAISLTPLQRIVAVVSLVGAALVPTTRRRRRRQHGEERDDTPSTTTDGTTSLGDDDPAGASSSSPSSSWLLLVFVALLLWFLLLVLQRRSSLPALVVGSRGGGERRKLDKDDETYDSYDFYGWEAWMWIASLVLSAWLGRGLAAALSNATCHYCCADHDDDDSSGSNSAAGVLRVVRGAFSRGGPLGEGCYKLWEALSATVMMMMTMMLSSQQPRLPSLWQQQLLEEDSSNSKNHQHEYFTEAPTFLSLGRPLSRQPWQVWIFLVALCLAVNGVLWLWSRLTKVTAMEEPTNQHAHPPHHPGVARMVEASLGRSLSVLEHAQLASLAVCNAVCEEVTSRGVWRWYFGQLFLVLDYKNRNNNYATDTSNQKNNYYYYYNYSNLCQALVFGLWHYRGIPSGLTGVALTFVYGGIMGLLADYNEGLGLSIVAHSIADYYIFAGIARQQQQSTSHRIAKKKKE